MWNAKENKIACEYFKDIFNTISESDNLMTGSELNELDNFIIKIIGTHGRIKGNTKIQKYGFLADQTNLFGSNNLNLDYVPHNYGPYSEKLKAGLDHLLKLKLVEVCELDDNGPKKITSYTLTTPKGQHTFQILAQTSFDEINLFRDMTSRFQKESLFYLLKFVYSSYPQFTINSTIKKEVLNFDY